MEKVNIWEEQVVIPTYEVGLPEKNPMFLEKRVYQGSCGKVYPYPTTEKISTEKTDKVYKAVYLENQYIKVMVLPELGGRIQRAYDKTNDYDFVYYNRVIKPALVGLTGPWISGGIEFNWPQHHRPTTFLPVDHEIVENEDGSKTLLIHDVDQMYGTKGITGFTLYPDKAYIEIRGQLYNRTPLAQTFLWWANPAVSVNNDTQSIFPPDVHSVMDHGKRDVSRFPIATGVYYKHDYSEGVDISRYKNIPVPTSYMAEKSEYDFVGGYDYGKNAGILHVADHHISPGKKQWTWGCGEFGQAWDRNLTDEDGPYIELMTGVYTDNQPDFTWLKPFEEKAFKQYFMPYKQVGAVKNATIHAMLNMELTDKGVEVCVYGTEKFENARIEVSIGGKVEAVRETTLSPVDIFRETFPVSRTVKESDVKVRVLHEEKLLVEYQPKESGIPELAHPAEPAKDPEEIMTNEELFLTGQHIEQYRHATYLPDPYYLEGLKRDPGDIRINNAYGTLLMRRGCFVQAEKYFRKALERLTWKNPNPYDSEAYYNLGLDLFYQQRFDEAFDAFYKATWSNEQQEMSFYYLACISARKGEYTDALAFVEKGLIKNAHNIKARGLKAVLLRKLHREIDAEVWVKENLLVDPFDYVSRFEAYLLTGEESCRNKMNALMRDFHENYLMTARDYGEAGFYEEAILLLGECTQTSPMLHYYKGYYQRQMGLSGVEEYEKGEKASPLYCFPNKLEDILVLEDVIANGSNTARSNYYLGCLYYDKLQFEKAQNYWEASEKSDSEYPTVLRNLALVYYNKTGEPKKARQKLEKAFALDPKDARVFLELDQLYKKLNLSPEERIRKFEDHKELIRERDDLLIEYITLLNSLGRHEAALDTMMHHRFRPWEGAEGKVTTQYKAALTELAKESIRKNEWMKAKEFLERALVYPENLGEGRLEGTKDNPIHYYLGCAWEVLENPEKAKEEFSLASLGQEEPAGMMYYYDQPADMILYKGLAALKRGDLRGANACFYKLLDYGEKHIRDQVRIDYFAVSLPDFLIFDEDLNKRNEAHCYYLMGLGALGLGRKDEARAYFRETLSRDQSHQNAIFY
ncbi:MAG: DUF5107 domain-containing protein [Eubacteriales bacterium]|nr:DUF5107 domain-containing protein [Eubacteriales bacterium]